MSIALSIEGNSLRIVSYSGKKVEQWSSTSFEPGLVKECVITDIPGMARIIKQAVSEGKFSTKNARCSLSSI